MDVLHGGRRTRTVRHGDMKIREIIFPNFFVCFEDAIGGYPEYTSIILIEFFQEAAGLSRFSDRVGNAILAELSRIF